MKSHPTWRAVRVVVWGILCLLLFPRLASSASIFEDCGNSRWLKGSPIKAGLPPAPRLGTIGIKRVLVIRANCPDNLSEPISELDTHNLLGAVQDFYLDSSYSKLGFTWAVTPVVTLPESTSYYKANGLPVTDVWDAAAAHGYYRTNYDADVILAVPIFGFSGVANPGTGTALIQNFTRRTTAHEIGHLFGLPHANAWFAFGNAIIGNGYSVEYGNVYDTMGYGNGHFNAAAKSQLQWLPDSHVQALTTNGVYRVHAFDSSILQSNQVYAVKFANKGFLGGLY